MPASRRMTFGRYDYATFISFLAYAGGSVVVPVALVELARDLNFPLEDGGMAEGGALHLGRTIPMVVAMVLCGFAAGRWGKRRTFGWSVVLMAVGVAVCAVAPIYGILMLGMLIAGFAEGIIEGLATPFVQDLHPQEPGRYISFAHAFWSLGVLVTVLAAGVLLTMGVSWRWLTGGLGALALIPAAMLLLPVGRKGTPFPEHPEPLHWRTVINHARAIMRIPRFWLFFAAMFVAGGGEFCLTFWCASYVQLSFNPAPWAGGVGTAFFAGGMVAGRIGWGYFIRQRQLPVLIVGSAVAGTAITLLFPTMQNLWLFFGLLFLAGIATGPFWPSVQSYCSDRLPGVDTTMLFVLLSCAGIPGCGFFAWLMGYLGSISGDLRSAFYLVPGCYMVLAVLIGWDMWGVRRNQRDRQ